MQTRLLLPNLTDIQLSTLLYRMSNAVPVTQDASVIYISCRLAMDHVIILEPCVSVDANDFKTC